MAEIGTALNTTTIDHRNLVASFRPNYVFVVVNFRPVICYVIRGTYIRRFLHRKNRSVVDCDISCSVDFFWGGITPRNFLSPRLRGLNHGDET